LLNLKGGEDYIICEVGTSNPGEIASLGRIVAPDIAVITSISLAHLENFETIERIAGEKSSILGCLKKQGFALGIVFGDSDLLNRSSRAYDCRKIYFGQSDDCQLRLTGYEPTASGCRFELNGRAWFDLPLPGRHNALNAIAAIAASQKFGFDQDQAAGTLASFSGTERRLERLTLGEITVINDAYNANPASMVAGAEVLSEIPGERKVFIAGDMLELGKAGPELAGQVGRDIASRGIDMVIGIGQLGSALAESAGQSGATIAHQFTDRDVDGREVAELIAPGDVVLIKASRGVGLERLVDHLRKRFGMDGGDVPDASGGDSA
ncbi:MAG TPA: UDP-N-acetylmuramoyl-tripeptide--D-alanyl-D-alanine ligase, partial [Thiolapillus brandeum]|nr:UDP-N-acetylmuramoyl-tripeptide--D-alanyl-D-alanine ligase [Thiolapillus brandeum]